jgi:hypothetical protein
MFPFGRCTPWTVSNGDFVRRLKFGTLQYVVVKVISTFLVFILTPLGVYHEGNFAPDSVYLYVAFINNCSQMWAMYCLVMIYHALHEELAPMQPFRKFVCIKAVVFFSFWQQVVVAGLAYYKVFAVHITYTTEDISRGLQDYLICIEMLVFAILHMYAFSHKDYLSEAEGGMRTPFLKAFLGSSLPTDVVEDVGASVQRITEKVKSTASPNKAAATAPSSVVQISSLSLENGAERSSDAAAAAYVAESI